MINSGLLIIDSLNILSDQMENRKFKEAVFSIKHYVEAGESLYEALARYPKVFPKFNETIDAIKKVGLDPIIKVIAKNLSEKEALLVEKTLIWKLGRTLTNISSGRIL